ncbi:hypothetical protein MC7420_4174 [Coleofasciculus chthonoplastes PCC 7420]|uniref:Helicase HerA central domain-containing protein n=1 Tax=Coleofasciculus chthonoplastes PCC 7420 TaxID=118168 RepID=B4VV08_9CYAN|nr:hypothetical protein [Coleofasciculus chthonoplastes]EDX74189.1 hypothetical protein MC7420_4174 [Coleofasciculus chthonoplastes PCC 7420]
MQLFSLVQSNRAKKAAQVKVKRPTSGKAKIGARQIHDGSTRRKGTPIEDAFSLVTMLRIELDGRKVGAYVLRKGENNFTIQFGFECKGIHPTLRADEIEPVFDALSAGLKDFPPSEHLTIHLSSFTTDVSRQEQLKQLIAVAPTVELKFLTLSERARVQELTRLGLRKPKTLRLYCTYTVEPDTTGSHDTIEKVLAKLERYWRRFTGELDKVQFLRMERLFTSAYAYGFQQWEQLLANKIGLQIRALTDEELWEILWQRFNSTPPIKVPQVVVLGERGLREEVHSELSPLTLLVEGPIPVAQRRWVKANGKYVGVLTFVDKPAGWRDKEAQLRYLWEVIAKDRVWDTEVFCQLTRANEALVKTNMQRLTKQANTATVLAADKNSIDVKAHLNIKKGVEAQEALYEGAVPFHTAVTFLVHRTRLGPLDEACRFLESLFLRPAWVSREQEYPWRVWVQTFPINWEKLLAKPFNRRQVYLTSEVPGLMPLVKTRTIDEWGLELVADEGGTPIYLDLFKQHKNLALFGTTRSGKSVMASGILTQALAHGLPVVVMDYPKPDGTSTFTDYTHFVGGSYFNVRSEAINLFELPDLSQLSPKDQNDRFEDYKDFLVSALMVMVVGAKAGESAREKAFSSTVRSILTLAIDGFFKDELIRDRYGMSYRAGFGSQEWQNMPTLRDFVPFCSYERLELDGNSGEIRTAMEQIKLRLSSWMESRVGKAISRPSTFRTDAQLLVFALANLSNDDDAAILSLSAYSAALRRALASPASIFFIDESPILFEYDAISNLVARLCANGAKAGVRVILSGQDPNTIAASPGGAKIFQNMTTRLVGRIQPTAVDSFVEILKYPKEVIARNASESFFPKKEGMYSQWLVDDRGTYTAARYYPGYVLLAAVANNPDEQAMRSAAMKRHGNKFVGLNQFSRELIASIRAS